MKLSRYTLKNISSDNVVVPDESIFELPERVLQFGTGRLLRGLPDYFIDKANRMGMFNGRIVMVKTTSHGDITVFDKQDGLYTLCERGIVDGEKREENIIISSVSRVLFAQNDWSAILECAHNPDMKIIISNTTEIGIQLVDDDIHHCPPVSYPGKILAFLYERFTAFNGDEEMGLVIVPTELIPDNAKRLESIVLELAHLNSLDDDFIEWLEKCNYFCNSLVDRIVTGMPDEEVRVKIENELGYKDELLVVSEVYRLWAIEGNEKIKSILSFARADKSVVIEADIDLYRELKLRLLNGTHTLTCGVAFLAGYGTVLSAMEDKLSSSFITDLMKDEIAPSISYEIDNEVKEQFILKVLDRFRNPYINHYWKNITLNYTSKMQTRCVPLLINYYKIYGRVPELFGLGFASYVYFMKAVKQNDKSFFGELDGEPYLIEDMMAEEFFTIWKNDSIDEIVKNILQSTTLWDDDLSHLPGFQKSVAKDLKSIIKYGMMVTLKNAFK
ncbi:MAG: tagaturonate reductase [Ginsengibacter sp.]